MRKSQVLRSLRRMLAATAAAAAVFVYLNGSGSKAEDIQLPASKVSPAGKLLVDAATRQPAAVPLTMNFVRTPDSGGPDGKGRYLIAVNSGFGLQFNSKSKAQQTLSVIDLTLTPEPAVIQTVYFPSPQSVNVGAAFSTKPQPDGTYRLFVAGGNTNKIFMFGFDPKAAKPLAPANEPDTISTAPSIDVTAF